MLKLSIFIFFLTQFLSICPLIHCEKNDDSSTVKKDVENETDLDSMDYVSFDKSTDEHDLTKIVNFIDPHSLFYDRHSKKVIDDVKILPIKQDKETLILRKNNEDCGILKVYYKRLILMLLSNANLKTEDDLVEGQLFIKGTHDQIETLKTLETETYSLKEIDLILSEIISKTPYYSYVPNPSKIIFSLFTVLNYNVEIIVITIMIVAIVVLLRTMSLFHAIVIILATIFMVSFYMSWCHLMKEAEIKLAVSQVKYTEMPVACQPHKMGVWDRLKSFMCKCIESCELYDRKIQKFVDNEECEKYVEARMSNPKLRVTPVVVFTHMFATVALHPVELVGETISKFINNATGHLYWLKMPVQIILYLCLPAFFMMLIFALRGGSVSFGLGPLFRFSFATHEGTSIPDTHKRQTVELIREVLAEVPRNAPLSINENAKSMPLSINNSIQEDNNSTDDLCKYQSTKLISNESEKEAICASGDSVRNDLLSEESKKRSKECVEAFKTDTVKHIGSGDA